MPSGALHWCFTYPARSDETPPPIFLPNIMEYLIFQKERGEGENNYEHYQGYTKFKSKKILSWITRNVWSGSRTHWEVKSKFSTVAQAIEYCQKEETRIAGPFEFGTPPVEKGSRTDLNKVVEDIKSNSFSKRQIVERNTCAYIKYSNGIDKVIQILKPIPEEKPICLLFYGDARVGKTTLAKSYGTHYFMPLVAAKPWFDHKYDGQDVIIIEEFEGQWDLAWMKLFLGERSCPIETKGAFCSNVSKYIIITSNTDPRLWYAGINQTNWKALSWRFSNVIRFVGNDYHDVQMFRDDKLDFDDPSFYIRDPHYKHVNRNLHQ